MRPAAIAALVVLTQPLAAQHNAARVAEAVERVAAAAIAYRSSPWHEEVMLQTGARMTVAFDPASPHGPAASLALGTVRVLAAEGRLVAWREGDTSRLRVVERPGRPTASMLRDELPPLWCPPLDAALRGGFGAAPVVGRDDDAVAPAQTRLEFDLAGGVVLVADGPGWTTRTTIAAGPPRVTRWSFEGPAHGTLHAVVKPARADSDGAWPWSIFEDDRTPRVASVAALGFKRGRVGVGAPLPDAPIADPAGGPWSVRRVFEPADQDSRPEGRRAARPAALVLAIARADDPALDDLLAAFDAGLAAGRAELAHVAGLIDAPAPLVLARPLLVTAGAADASRVAALADGRRGVGEEPLLSGVEARTPAVLWSPSRELAEADDGVALARVVLLGPDGRVARIVPWTPAAVGVAELVSGAGVVPR